MTTRRNVLKGLAAILLSAILWPVAWAKGQKEFAILLDSVEKLKEVGGWSRMKVNKHKVLLVRDSDATVKAFQSTCTHRKEKLTYDHQQKALVCPAHGSRFDLQGTVLNGPAKKSLEVIPARLEGERIILTLED